MSTVLRLRAHELHEALSGADIPRAVGDELLWREVAATTATLCRRAVGGWHLGTVSDDQVFLYGEHSDTGLLLPTAGLQAIRAAALTATAATLFVEPRVITVAVLGSGLAARLQVAALATHVPGVSHIAVHGLKQVPSALAERLAAAGVGLTIAERAADAVLGANLVVLAGPQNEAGWTLPNGTVMVNATGEAVPLDVPVDQVFVDDRRLLASYLPDIADLGQVLAGTHPGRTDSDDVVLIDLLTVEAGGLWLTHQLLQAALRQDLGEPADTLPGGSQLGQ
jgi:hypothetical protein